MGYLTNFEYDVFLSYAHKDNETVNEKEGWMTQFYKQFKLYLDQYLEGTNTAKVWCDFELRKNIAFNDEIRRVLTKSGIFLAFTSNSFYRSEYCCKDELSFFYNTARQNSLGVKVENKNRLFQVQLLNKNYTEWPEEFQGVGCYKMFKNSNDIINDDPNDQGIILDEKADETKYKKNMIEIVQDVCNTLKAIKSKETTQADEETVNKSKVFFGKVSDTLLPLRDQISKELEAGQFSVYKCQLPPPYPKDEYDKKVAEKISESDIAIHLFDHVGGDKINDEYPYSFLQEQALIGIKSKKNQLIFIPQELLTEKDVEDATHKKFLSDLFEKKEADSNYNIIKEFSVPNIIEHIKNKLVKKEDGSGLNAVLLDFNDIDRKYAVDYYYSIANQQNVFLTLPSINPIDFINSFNNALLSVKTIIIIWYEAADEWIKQRIKDITCAIKTGKSKVSEIFIYKNSELSDLDLKTLLLMV